MAKKKVARKKIVKKNSLKVKKKPTPKKINTKEEDLKKKRALELIKDIKKTKVQNTSNEENSSKTDIKPQAPNLEELLSRKTHRTSINPFVIDKKNIVKNDDNDGSGDDDGDIFIDGLLEDSKHKDDLLTHEVDQEDELYESMDNLIEEDNDEDNEDEDDSYF